MNIDDIAVTPEEDEEFNRMEGKEVFSIGYDNEHGTWNLYRDYGCVAYFSTVDELSSHVSENNIKLW